MGLQIKNEKLAEQTVLFADAGVGRVGSIEAASRSSLLGRRISRVRPYHGKGNFGR